MKKKNVIVCLVCVCFLKKVIKNTILFKEREKERVWSFEWAPQLLTYLQKDHLTTLIEN